MGILLAFSMGVYGFFSRHLYRQLDKNLRTLAQSASPTHTAVESEGQDYLERVDEVPWRDIFNRDKQSLEWFDRGGQLLGSKGVISLSHQPQLGGHTYYYRGGESPYPVRTYTVSVFQDGDTRPAGYVRSSQSLARIEATQRQLLWGLGLGGAGAIAIALGSGVWLSRKALDPVEQNLEQLRQFTADASHELRSPLTAIKMSVEVMQNHPERIHPKDAKKLAAIASATAQMSHLVEDLLLLARMDAVAMREREPSLVSLVQVLLELVEMMEVAAKNNEISLKTHLLPELWIVGHRHQLSRLFANLLRNAIEYTPSGGTVTLSMVKYPWCCEVRVEDTGIGIAPEHQTLVFERFWRADRSRSGPVRGTGLGLPIAAAIARAHGGKISLRSQLKVGSCFTVRLPLSPQRKLGGSRDTRHKE